MAVRDAYQKMFEDGSAYRPIKIDQPSPNNENGRGMGHEVNQEMSQEINNDHESNREWMIQEAMRLKEAKGKKVDKNIVRTQPPITYDTNSNKEIKKLRQRIDIVEQALKLVMETQTKLIRESIKEPTKEPEDNGESIKTETA